MKIITKAFAVTALLFMSLSVNAAVIAINYEVTDVSTGTSTFWGDGSFTGVDSNADNMLTLDELTSFSGSNNDGSIIIGLSNLIETGAFDIANNTWMNNAKGWPNHPDDAWFTWDDNSVNEQWAVVTTSAVPAPPAVWLFISGLIFLIGVMRKRASKLAVISA